jgi:predicted permease
LGFFDKQRMDQEFNDELEAHLQMHVEDNLRLGMKPDEARRQALIKLGGIESTKEAYRDQRGLPVVERLWQDVRYGARMLAKHPGFTAAAVTTLALGIGANTAVFSLFSAVILRPLPFQAPERLVWISNPVAGEGLPGLTRRSNFLDWKESNRLFENLGAYIGFSDRMSYTVSIQGEFSRVAGALVTGNFLETLGVIPRLGRSFVTEECQRNGPRAIILTHRFWHDRLEADTNIVGKSVTLNNMAWSVVGVLPASFDFSRAFMPGASAVDFLHPYQDTPRYDNWGNMMAVVGRLNPGVSVAAAQARLDLLNQQLRVAHPERGRFGARVTPLREHVSGSFRRPFIVLACAVACVLLIACANLSNLLLARAAARRKEIAVRIALGAGRARLIRQLLTESLLLSCSGALLGLPIAYLATNAVTRLVSFNIPLLQNARVDTDALGFAALLAFAATLAFGLAPALQLSRPGGAEDLKEAGRGPGSAPGVSRIRKGLIVSEVAMACILLVIAGLLMRSFAQLLQVDPGFSPAQAASWRIVPNREFATHQQEVSFYRGLVERVEALPEVESATLASTLPFELNDVARVRPVLGSELDHVSTVFLREVGGVGYFKTMGIPLRAGRDFTTDDASTAPKAIVVNETLARRFWPGLTAIDQLLVLENPPDPPVQCKVLGVVGDVPQSALEQATGPEMYMFAWGGRELIVRTRSSLASAGVAVRSTLRDFSPSMAVDEFKPLKNLVENMVSPKRLVALLLALFSLLALLLASIGIYGVVAYSVSQRTREIGIRLALGSSRDALLGLVIWEGMSLTLLGCGIGLMAGWILARVFRALLFHVSPTDPIVFVSTAVLLLLVAFAACWLPARRATKVDPMIALRND